MAKLFGSGTLPEARRIGDILRAETFGGLLLLGAAVAALVWANSPWADAYRWLSDLKIGPLTLAAWSSDGLLAIFFFVAGLELKREFV
ncbi:MAG TPA: Na+/H+ antiporter NhaA, partial [Actinoplanes sp.]|nr:Na+/H+ antiporter NhaA [Actinoplanes sp.]